MSPRLLRLTTATELILNARNNLKPVSLVLPALRFNFAPIDYRLEFETVNILLTDRESSTERLLLSLLVIFKRSCQSEALRKAAYWHFIWRLGTRFSYIMMHKAGR